MQKLPENRCQAIRYMKIARTFPELLNSSGATSHLKLSQAIELLNAPDEVQEEVIKRVESGEQITVKEIQELKRQAREAEQKAQSILLELNQRTNRSSQGTTRPDVIGQ